VRTHRTSGEPLVIVEERSLVVYAPRDLSRAEVANLRHRVERELSRVAGRLARLPGIEVVVQ
jgi:hypothetical protein